MEYISLSAIALLKAGGTPSRQKNEYWRNGDIPWLTITDIKGKYVYKSSEYITNEGLNNSSAKMFKKGTLIYTIFATVGEVAFLDFDTTTNQAIANIELVDSRFNYDFLYYYLLAIKKRVLYDSKGVAQNNINLGYLKELKIPLISLEMQQKIVLILDKINAVIDADKKQLELLDEAVKSRFIEMFGDAIQNEKKWAVKKLNDITDVRDGTHDSPKYYDKGYPFVTSKNLINGEIDFSSCQFICEEDYLHFNDRSCVDDGDILMPMIGTIGGAVIVKKDRDFSIKNVALIKFNKDNSIINRKYILSILNSDAMNSYFNNTKKGGTQKFIALGVIRDIPIILPPVELQNEFASFVELIDKSKFNIQQHLNLMQELLDKKMDEYFGGE